MAINGTDGDLGSFGEITYFLENDFGLFKIDEAGLGIVAKLDFADLATPPKELYNLTLIGEDGGGLKARYVISVEVVPPEALRSSAAFTTISLLGGIFAGAMTVLLIFIAVVVLFKRRKRADKSDLRVPAEYKVSKAAYLDWAIEVPTDGNCSSGLTIAGEPIESDSSCSRLRNHQIKTVQIRTDSNETNSDHITDSGKGESEHGSFSFNNLQAETSKRNHTIHSVLSQSKFGPHCVQECGIYGHSDSCWLNNVTLIASRGRPDKKSNDVQVSSITEFNLEKYNQVRKKNIKNMQILF